MEAYGNAYFPGAGISDDAVVDGYAASLYDAVHLFAHAATKVLEAGGDVRDGAAMTEAMKAAAFTGVLQAQVKLDGSGDMIEQ